MAEIIVKLDKLQSGVSIHEHSVEMILADGTQDDASVIIVTDMEGLEEIRGSIQAILDHHKLAGGQQ